MNTSIFSDASAFNVFKNKALILTNHLKNVMQDKAFESVFKIEVAEETRLFIRYLGRRFKIINELKASDGYLPRIASLNVYLDMEKGLVDDVFVFGYSYDSSGKINERFAPDEFAPTFLEDFAARCRITLFTSNKPTPIR